VICCRFLSVWWLLSSDFRSWHRVLRCLGGDRIVCGYGNCCGAATGSTIKLPAEQNADETKSQSLQNFMRLKLTASEKILEGLILENHKLVHQGAQSLHKISSTEKWRVSNDPLYRQFSDEFQRNTGELAKAAEDHDLDQAALKWFAATMNCIECHKFVRNNLVVKLRSPSKTCSELARGEETFLVREVLFVALRNSGDFSKPITQISEWEMDQ